MPNIFSISQVRKAINPAIRGYQPVYHSHEVNRCPGCGRTHWLIGRLLAECAFCATALPLTEGGMTGGGRLRSNHRFAGDAQLAA